MKENNLVQILGICLLGILCLPAVAQAQTWKAVGEGAAKVYKEFGGTVKYTQKVGAATPVLKKSFALPGKIEKAVEEARKAAQFSAEVASPSVTEGAKGSRVNLPIQTDEHIKTIGVQPTTGKSFASSPTKYYSMSNYASQSDVAVLSEDVPLRMTKLDDINALLDQTSLCKGTRHEIIRQAQEKNCTIDEVKDLIGDALIEFAAQEALLVNTNAIGENMLFEINQAISKYKLSIKQVEKLIGDIKRQFLNPSQIADQAEKIVQQMQALETGDTKALAELTKIPADQLRISQTSAETSLLSPAEQAVEYSFFEGFYDGRTKTALEIEKFKAEKESVLIEKYGQIEVYARRDWEKIVVIDAEFKTISYYLPKYYLVIYKPKYIPDTASAVDAIEFPAIWDSVGTEQAFIDVVTDRHLSLRQAKELARAVKGQKFTYETLTAWIDEQEYFPISYVTEILSNKTLYEIAKEIGLHEEVIEAFRITARGHYLTWKEAEEFAQAIKENNLEIRYFDDLAQIMFKK